MNKPWIWNLSVLLGIGAIALVARSPEPESRIAPYRFAVRAKTDDDVALAFLRDRTSKTGEGLDFAALAGALLGQAKRTGQSRFIDEAELAARRSLEILPVSNPGATLALAQAAQMKHDFAGSIALCGTVLKERPRDARALALVATAQLGIGRLDDAIAAADALVDRLPTSPHLALRAVVLWSRGEEAEAQHDFTKALRVEEAGDPEGSAWLRSMWARLELLRGRVDNADDLLDEALRICPGLPLALGLRGDLEAGRGHVDDADRHYGDAYRRSGDPLFLLKRARIRPTAAEELRSAAEKALREAPGHRLQLAQALLDRGAAAEALEIAESEALRRRNAETLDTLARARAAAGRLLDARDAIREAIRGGVRDASLQLRAADIEARLGHESLAAMHRAIAREIHP
jgi:tetratricopeptide (TPR) repeat protein